VKRISESSQKRSGWMGGALLGALAMYLSDPDKGRRRRARAQDKIRHYSLAAAHGADLAARDSYNHLRGFLARTVNRLSRRGRYDKADDQVVAGRVRAMLGRIVSHPHAIRAEVHQGRASLTGPVLASEKKALLDAVRSIPGIADIDDRLEAHKRPAGVPGLQGGSGRTPIRSGLMQANWTPALRGSAILGGGTLGLYGLTRRTPLGAAIAAIGLAVLARGVTNMPIRRLIGANAGRRAIDLQKTIDIAAAPETVFDVWTNYENFPHFMSHIREARDLGQRRSHWIVQGPMGAPMEWNARLTECIRPSVLAWKTEPGATVEHAGIIRFESIENGTRVTVRMSYNPPAGALGHGVAALFGRDPKRQLDDDLMRMKSFIENGIPPRDAAQPVNTATPSLL